MDQCNSMRQLETKKDMYICSDHFTPDSFLPIKGLGRQKLKPNAVPSIFPKFPQHLQVSPKPKRRSPKKHKIVEPHGLVTYSSQRHKSRVYTEEYDPETASWEKLLIELDQEGPSEMLDNVLYYIGGYILQSLLRKVDCEQCKEALLLDTENPHGQNMVFYPLQAKFTCFKQMGGLLFPSIALLKILKAAEVIFR